MALLGNATTVSAQTGRKLNNALTLTFKTSAEHTLATAVQAKSLGVLFGFKNGGSGRYDLSGPGGELAVDCAPAATRVSRPGGAAVGSIEKGEKGEGLLRTPEGSVAGRISAYPKESKADSAWQHQLTGAAGEPLGTLTWVRTTGKINLLDEVVNTWVWWDRAGESLKVPSLGAGLSLNQALPEVLGDLLMAACVDMTVGSHSFFTV